MKEFYGQPPAGIDPTELVGKLIVLEGPDASGRSTHNARLADWLEQKGYAVTQVGLNRSALVGPELDAALAGNVLSPRTRTLFYASDFYDQLENVMVPALRAGYVVLADRYIFTLMAREIVRGADKKWLDSIYQGAVVPDAVLYLHAPPEVLAQRALMRDGTLDYWESGMDMGLDRDWYASFIDYQGRMAEALQKLAKKRDLDLVSADQPIPDVQKELRKRVRAVLPTA